MASKPETMIGIIKSTNLIEAKGVHGGAKVSTTAPPDTGRVVVTRKTTGSVELRYVPLEPNPPEPQSSAQ